MSDENDRRRALMIVALVEVYETLRLIGLFLPVPVRLPHGPEFRASELVPAVRRFVSLIEDQPMPEDEKALLWGATLHWCSAAMVVEQYLINPDRVTALQAELLIEESGHSLIDFLDHEEGTGKEETDKKE